MKLLPASLAKDKLNREEQVELLNFLSTSLQNGFPLSKGLQLLPLLWPKKAWLRQLDEQVRGGGSFSEELVKLGYSKTAATQLNIALSQGKLQESLAQLAQLARMKNEQIKKLEGELAYPIVLAIMMTLLLVFMQNFLSVQFADSSAKQGDFLIYLLVIATATLLAAIAIMAGYFKKQDYGSLLKLTKVPFIGEAVKLYGQYLICYDLGMLLASGFSLQEMCFFASQQTKGSLQEAVGKKVSEQLKGGKDLSKIIQEEPFLNANLLLLVETGASRRDLSKQCLLLAKLLFTRLTQKIEKMIVNVQPICFILIGLCIIGMYLKLLLPIYGSMQRM